MYPSMDVRCVRVGSGGVTVLDQPGAIPLNDQLRGRWLLAVSELGVAAAAEDAAQAFVQRSGCTIEEGRLRVHRAWQMLGITRPSRR